MAAWLSSFFYGTNTPPPRVNSIERFNDFRDTQDGPSSIMTHQPGPELTQYLLPNMPSLFTLDLPPCGLEPQLAYKNIAQSLRRRWLRAAANPSTQRTALDIALWLAFDLDHEAAIQPPGSLAHTKTRQPWRRENVFNFEMRWVAYFVREAKLEGDWGEMDAEKRCEVEYSQLKYLIPQELGMAVRRRGNVEGMQALWREWHVGKRRDLEVVKRREEMWEDKGEMVTLKELVGRKFEEKNLVEAEKKMEVKRGVERDAEMKKMKEKIEKLEREVAEREKMERKMEMEMEMERKMGLEKQKDAEEKKEG